MTTGPGQRGDGTPEHPHDPRWHGNRVRAVYERGDDAFSRVVYFSDAVFAIAMTLLVVGIDVPDVAPDELGAALNDAFPQIFSFFLSFLILAYYWIAHHRFYSGIVRMSRLLIGVNLTYLAVIAFLPFPTGVLGEYEQEPISVVIFAATLGVASILETVLFVVAARGDMFRQPVDAQVFRFGVAASTAPTVVFALAIPIALVWPSGALYSFLLIFPAERLIDRWWRPRGFTGISE